MQEAFLDRACGDDSRLRSQVEKMLAAGRLDRSPVEVVAGKLGLPCEETSADPEADAALTSDVDTGIAWLSGDSELDVSAHPLIDSYKLLEQIGQGGMGVVYMAQQTAPVKRKVALKVIKAGMDSKEVIARFEAERQALAMMDHPHIAKVLDGGTTAAGRPYFVMELVRGVPITEFCHGKKLGLRERIELFIDVCKAVQHAHQKGVIHRDLKPSNLLVTMHDDKAVVKVIDFGVAKALNQELTERTLFTQFSQMIGTPLYMAPEQAQMSGLDIDTRSDIYSLGVVLYELLTGTTPFDRETMSKLGMDGIRKLLNEQEPLRPSVRISTLRAANQSTIEDNRRIDVPELCKQLRRELDWIVMKALEKDRERRYESANAFAADVQRYLDDEPVEACPPSTIYRLRKLARRHKGIALTTVAVAAALILGIVGTSWQAINASNERQRAVAAELAATQEANRANKETEVAKEKATTARAISDFLLEDLLAQTNPDIEPERDIKLRTVLDRAAEKIDARFDNQPTTKSEIHFTIGSAYLSLGEYEPAEEHLRVSLAAEKPGSGEDHAAIRIATVKLADVLSKRGKYSDAARIYQDAIAACRRSSPPDEHRLCRALSGVATCLLRQGRFAEAEAMDREAIAIAMRIFKPEDLNVLRFKSNLASTLAELGKKSEAERLNRELLVVARRNLGDEHPLTLLIMLNLTHCMVLDNETGEREALLRGVMQGSRNRLGSQHSDSLMATNNYSVMLNDTGKYEEAEKLLNEACGIASISLGEEHYATLSLRHNLACAFNGQERYDEADTILDDVLSVYRKSRGEQNPLTVAAERLVSNVWTNRTWKLAAGRNSEQSDLAQAVNFGRLSVELQRDSDQCWSNFGVALFRAGQYQEAVEAFEKADAMIDGGDRVHRMFFAMAQWQLGNKHDAERLYAEESVWISTQRSSSEEQMRFCEEAEQLMGISEEERKERIVKYYDRLETNDMQLRTERGKWYLANGEHAKAIVDFTAVLEQEPESINVDLWRWRGTAQMQAQRYGDAVADFSRALQLKPDHLDSLTQRGRAYLILEQFELALVDLDRAITIEPSVARYNYRGQAQRGLGNFQAALADLAKVIELDRPNR